MALAGKQHQPIMEGTVYTGQINWTADRHRRHEQEKRLIRWAAAASIAVHLGGTLLIGVSLRPQPPLIPTSLGYAVELVELSAPARPAPPKPQVRVEKPAKEKETVSEVKAPRPGVKPKVKGDVPVPQERSIPKTKPKIDPDQRRPRPMAVQTARADSASRMTALSSAVKGAGGRLEAEAPFPFDYYIESVMRLIMSRWTPVGGADANQAVVHFFIGRKGDIANLELLQSSGDAFFDRSTLSAVRSVPEFLPLPQGFPADRLGVRFHFEYQRGY